jgi:UDP-N-acetylmuramate--alanine ligase
MALILLERGASVSGSDCRDSALLQRLAAKGATVSIGHTAANVRGADLVVVSSAVPKDNPELLAARAAGIPVLNRAEFIGQMMVGHYGIAVAGTHGKTTTTAMLALILSHAGLSPSFMVGGVSRNLGTNARVGHGPHFIIEADEYDHMFWGLNPQLAVVTNVEMDHPDCYRDIEQVTAAFKGFLDRVVPGGYVVGNGDEWRVRTMLTEVATARVETYGLSEGRDWQAKDIQRNDSGGYSFFCWHNRVPFGRFDLQVPGIHNVLNALAAIAAVTEVGVSLKIIQDALLHFEGTSRRFEHKGTVAGVDVIDDYAHHPTEVRATLVAARVRYPGRRLWAVFQPHTFSRFKTLLEDFATAFESADHMIVTDIFAARETETLGAHASDLIRIMDHPDARYIAGFESVVDTLAGELRPGDVVITLGAGDCYQVGEALLKRLQNS